MIGTLDSHVPGGPLAERWTQHKFDMKLVAPNNRRKFDVIIVGSGPGRRQRGRHARRAGLQRQGLHVPRQPAAGALDRRPGRDQRGEELQGRRRLRAAPLLRHHQGRRLPLPRVERAPAGRGVGRHHRPDGGPGRAVRPRVRRPARQPLLRRRPGEPHLLRPRPDRPAAPARRLPADDAPGARRHRRAAHPLGDARPRREGRRGLRDHRARPRHRPGHPPLGPRRAAVHRRLRQRVLPLHQRQVLQRVGARGERTDGGRCSPTPATRRSTPRASRPATSSSRSSR